MNMKQLSDAEVLDGLNTGLSMSAEGYRRAAPFYVEAKRRGMDLSAIDTPILRFLPDVAAGTLCPEILVRFGASPRLVSKLAKLPGKEQGRIARGDGRVAIGAPSGVKTVRLVDLTGPEIERVVALDHIREPAEQPPAPAPRRPAAGDTMRKPEYDIRKLLTPHQLKRLEAAAKRADVAPAQLLVRWAVAANLLPGSPMPITAVVRRSLQDSLARKKTG